jgi:hypothetical protein
MAVREQKLIEFTKEARAPRVTKGPSGIPAPPCGARQMPGRSWSPYKKGNMRSADTSSDLDRGRFKVERLAPPYTGRASAPCGGGSRYGKIVIPTGSRLNRRRRRKRRRDKRWMESEMGAERVKQTHGQQSPSFTKRVNQDRSGKCYQMEGGDQRSE